MAVIEGIIDTRTNTRTDTRTDVETGGGHDTGTGSDAGQVRVQHDWWGEVLRTVADGDRPMVVEDATGNRFVLVSEARYTALQEAERTAAAPRRPGITLTTREQEVLQMVADGCPGTAIAERLGLAPNTVAQHLASVRRKYGVRSSVAAATLARREGLIV